jgi:hypothetical protein
MEEIKITECKPCERNGKTVVNCLATARDGRDVGAAYEVTDDEHATASRRRVAHEAIRTEIARLNDIKIMDRRDQSLEERAPAPSPPTIGQRADGSWYWLDETWNEGDDIKHATYEAASAAQMTYCRDVLGT